MSRNTHERGDSWHRGSLRATLVDVDGTDLETWLRGVWDRIVALEVATPIGYPSFSLDSVLLGTRTGSATLAAALLKGQSAQAWLDSVLRATQEATAQLDSVLRVTQSGSALLDAYLASVASDLRTGSFTADAILQSSIYSSLLLDSVLLSATSGSFPLDSVRKAVTSAGFSLDSVRKATLSGSFTADAILKKTLSQSFVLDAVLLGLDRYFSLDAQIQKTGVVRPTSDVTSSASGDVTTNAGSSTWWDKIDETTNSNTDWVGTRNTGLAYFVVGCGSLGLSGNYIQKIVVSWRGTNSAPSSAIMPIVRNPSTGTTYDAGSSVAQGGTTSDSTLTTRPWGGSWTASDVNSLQIGHRSSVSGPYNNRCGSMFVTIYYQ